MDNIIIREAQQQDFDGIVELNQAVVEQTSAMDSARLMALHEWSAYHKVITVDDVLAGFLLVMPAGVSYDGINYQWFNNHYQNFYYVDRIVISDQFTGRKLGSQLYKDLFAVAKAQKVDVITCEYNIKPLNQVSQAFHDRFGFREVGRLWLDKANKQVSLQAANIS